MNNAFKDLNLLRIFAALWVEKNVTAAAIRLNLSQPALSHALQKLRNELGDPVFVRSGRGMSPTPRAEAWAPKVLAALEYFENAFADAKPFSPKEANERIVIVGTDLIEAALFAPLLKVIEQEAPQMTIISRPSDGQFPKVEMERGSVDFAIAGFFLNTHEGFYRKHLANEGYLTVACKNNKKIKSKMDLKTFASLSHILTSPQGDLYGVVDQALEAVGASRRVVAGVSTFQVIGKLIAGTEYCSTIPSKIALELAEQYKLNVYKPPVDIPPIKMHIFWHQRIHQSPVHRWVKEHIELILAEKFA